MNMGFKADQVGSFLRPRKLLDAHSAHAQGNLPLESLRAIEDESILEVLEVQRKAGIDILSDGEFRRPNWSGGFLQAVEGFVDGTNGHAPSGRRFGLRGKVIGEKLRKVRRLTDVESRFMKAHSPGPYKVTMPAPSYIVARAHRPGITDIVYPDRNELLQDVAAILREEVEALVAEGVQYIQFDNPHYPDYLVEARREEWRAEGIDPDEALRQDIAADNAAFEGLDLGTAVIGMHLCRGNGPGGAFHTSGGYDDIAEELFNTLTVDRFLLEYDNERAGGFTPLKALPKGKTAVLGLITTKSGQLESQAEIIARIEEATKYASLDDLALSPQCGFASVMEGNPVTPEEQSAKLELVASVARTVWRGAGPAGREA